MLLTSCLSQKHPPAVRSRDCWRCRPFACHFSHGSHVFAFCRDQQILVAEHSLPLEPGRCQASVVRDTLPARCPACCQRGGTSTPQDAVLGCCLRHLVSVPTMLAVPKDPCLACQPTVSVLPLHSHIQKCRSSALSSTQRSRSVLPALNRDAAAACIRGTQAPAGHATLGFQPHRSPQTLAHTADQCSVPSCSFRLPVCRQPQPGACYGPWPHEGSSWLRAHSLCQAALCAPRTRDPVRAAAAPQNPAAAEL